MKQLIKKTLVAASLLAAGLGSAWADITVGVTVSATGPAASLGIPEKNTIDLMPKQIGKVKINYIVLDDASDTTAAVTNARKLITEHKVDVIIGSTTTPNSLAMIDVVSEAKTPMISMAASARIVEPVDDKKRWVFKTPQNDIMMSQAIIEHMAANNITGHVWGCIGRFEGVGYGSSPNCNTCTPGGGMSLTGDASAQADGPLRPNVWVSIGTDDTITGTAVYTGVMSDYTITAIFDPEAGSGFEIRDNRPLRNVMTLPASIEKARFNMIEQQIRPWDVLDPQVLAVLGAVPRELFTPPEYQFMAYVDEEIPLAGGHVMLPPRIDARLMHDLALKGTETVLDIGTGSGYRAALLAHRSREVVSSSSAARFTAPKAAMSRWSWSISDCSSESLRVLV